MSLPTLSQSVSNKGFYECLNHKKKLNLRHPLPIFGSFRFFQASLWLRVDKVLQKLNKSYKSELRHLFQWFILITRKCPDRTPLQHTPVQGRTVRNNQELFFVYNLKSLPTIAWKFPIQNLIVPDDNFFLFSIKDNWC